jgi:hypothetical protein
VFDTYKGQLDLEQHGGRTPAGVLTRIWQRVLALTAVIWQNDNIGAPIKRSLIATTTDPLESVISYKDRYQILCQRLVRERLYDAACFVTSSADPSVPVHQPSAELSFENFVAAIAGRAAYVRALGDQHSDL